MRDERSSWVDSAAKQAEQAAPSPLPAAVPAPVTGAIPAAVIKESEELKQKLREAEAELESIKKWEAK